MSVDIKKIGTEQRNSNTMNIDTLPTLEIVKKINDEDKTVAFAVEKASDQIAKLVDEIVKSFHKDGRLIYMGAGTSGRIGILDAVECRPTYSVDDEMVQCLMAGGMGAMTKAVEGAEDSKEMAIEDLKKIELTENDIVVGITASGRTPYVLGAVEYANSIGSITIGVNNNPDSELSRVCKVSICPVTGPEAITGSTRMKAGTAQKLVLNMISTGVMIKYGKVYQNLMVDVKASNDKLRDRCKSIVIEATGVSMEEAEKILITTNYNCKLAIFIIISKLDITDAKKILDENKGYIRKALEAVRK